MRRMNTDGAATVKGRAAVVLASVLMILSFIVLDNFPDLAVFFLIAGVIITGITLFALKRQIENEMSRMQEAKRTECTRTERADGSVIGVSAAIAIPDTELPIAEIPEIEELAVRILTTEDLAVEAPYEEADDKMDNGKPYVAPSYDLFD